MHKLKDITEDEMIAVFLKGEIDSHRFGDEIIRYLQKNNLNRKLIDKPDISSVQENDNRRSTMTHYRGYGTNIELFENLPENIHWQRMSLQKSELKDVQYIDYSYWNKLSGGSRSPFDAAGNIKKGIEIFNISNKQFLKAAEFVRMGDILPELILVSKDEQSHLVVLEGHLRITAYMLAFDNMPNELEVIVGYADEITKWDLY